MASAQDIHQQESQTTHTVALRLEGIFYKAYNESAYLFSKYVKPYQINVKFIQKIQQYQLSLGFPAASLQKILPDYKGPQDDVISVKVCEEPLNRTEYDVWKATYLHSAAPRQAQQSAQTVSADATDTSADTSLKNQILNFQLNNATPMECMNFLNRLQKELLQHG